MIFAKVALNWLTFLRCKHRQPPVNLADIPQDVIFLVCLFLSVKDLFNLRQTSRYFFLRTNDRSIWLTVLRDILEVRPMPRLRFALEEMSLDECIRSTLRIAFVDQRLRGLDPTDLEIVRTWPWRGKPTVLPGGKHFVMLTNNSRSLMVHSSEADSLSEGCPLIPPSPHPLIHWAVIPVSSDEIVVATAALEMHIIITENVIRRTSHVSIYRCNPATGMHTQLDYFIIGMDIINPPFLDNRCIAVRGGDRGGYFYVRFYAEGLDSSLLRVNEDLDLQGSLFLPDEHHVIIAHPKGTYVYVLPPLNPIGKRAIHLSDSTASLAPPTVFRASFDIFNRPFLTPLGGPCQIPCLSIWYGRMMTAIDIQQPSIEYPRHLVWPEYPYNMPSERRAWRGDFCGMYTFDGDRITAFPIENGFLTSRGHLRLDTEPCGTVPLTNFHCPSLIIESLSYDEESGRLLMSAKMSGDACVVVLAKM